MKVNFPKIYTFEACSLKQEAIFSEEVVIKICFIPQGDVFKFRILFVVHGFLTPQTNIIQLTKCISENIYIECRKHLPI